MGKWVLYLYFFLYGLSPVFNSPVMGQVSSIVTAESVANFDSDSLVTVIMKDGNRLNGQIIRQDGEGILLRTPAGLTIEIPDEFITSIKVMRGRVESGKYFRFDPNYSRLLFSPTGRPLEKGDGYVTDYYVFFPGVAYGITGNLSVMAGFSLFPGIGFGNQMKYAAIRAGQRFSSRLAASGGVLYSSIPGEFAAGLTFGVITVGEVDKSLTGGLGFGYTRESGGEFTFGKNPVFLLGGNIRLSNNLALVSENWFILGQNVSLNTQPFTLALRFFGEQIAVDVGALLVGEILQEGFPVPWLSFVYNF